MRRRRVLSWFLSVCIICSVVCGTASASDILTLDEMGIDPWGELQDIQEQQAENSADPALDSFAEGEILQDARADVASLAASDAPTWTISKTGNTYYGFSVSNRSVVGTITNNAWSGNSYGRMQLGLISGSSSTGKYYSYTSAGKIQMKGTCLYTASDYETLKIVGVVGGHLYLEAKATGVALNREKFEPISVNLLINGSVYGDAVNYGESADWTVEFNNGLQEITSIGYQFNFPKYEWSTSTDYSGDRILGFWFDDSAMKIGGQDATTGLLSSILGWLQSILNAILSLPGDIANAILSGLQSLFVPSQEDFTNLKAQYETLLEERLGFIWQAGEWLVTFGQSILTAVQGGNEYTFTFPGISFAMNGTTYVLAEPAQVNLQNAFFDVVRPVLGTIVAMVCVVAFVHTAEDMVTAVVSGATYFEFLKGRREDDS